MKTFPKGSLTLGRLKVRRIAAIKAERLIIEE
jgi:hypothetical protein